MSAAEQSKPQLSEIPAGNPDDLAKNPEALKGKQFFLFVQILNFVYFSIEYHITVNIPKLSSS